MSRILVIDDSPTVRERLRQVLSAEGYEVLLASDGQAGIDAHRGRPCDLVITDLLMPQKEGIETIMELKREFPEVKIIAISAGSVMLDKRNLLRAAERLGAQRTLRKPIANDDLLASVRELIARPDPARTHSH